jgi:hypothetical protein
MAHVWKQSHEPGTLDGIRKCPLVLGGKAGLPAVKDASVRIQKLGKDFRILIVYELDVVLVEIILFVHGSND